MIVNARNTDPFTSHLAGYDIEASSKAHNQRVIAFAAVKANPGMTSRELAQHCELGRYQIARRLSEITGIKRGSKRYCKEGKKLCVTWHLI